MQKRLKDFPMYLEKGNIFSEYSKKYLKTHLNNRGYVVCQLRDINSKNCIVLLHRLVAKTYIPNKNADKPIHTDFNLFFFIFSIIVLSLLILHFNNNIKVWFLQYFLIQMFK